MGIHKSSSKSKAMRHRNYVYHKSRRQEEIASSIREQEIYAHRQPNDKVLFDQGESWFNSGLSLEDADEELKTNRNFVNGFNRAKRIRDVEISLYELGSEFYNNGVSLENIPENYRKNPTVLKGYEDAKNKANVKK